MYGWLNYSDSQIAGVLAAVDATKEKKIGDQFKITGFPTVKYFKYVAFKCCQHWIDFIRLGWIGRLNIPNTCSGASKITICIWNEDGYNESTWITVYK